MCNTINGIYSTAGVTLATYYHEAAAHRRE